MKKIAVRGIAGLWHLRIHASKNQNATDSTDFTDYHGFNMRTLINQ